MHSAKCYPTPPGTSQLLGWATVTQETGSLQPTRDRDMKDQPQFMDVTVPEKETHRPLTQRMLVGRLRGKDLRPGMWRVSRSLLGKRHGESCSVSLGRSRQCEQNTKCIGAGAR